MTSNDFLVDDYYELLALHRTFMEAKYCDEPNSNDISGSPIIASLHERLVETLIEAEVQRKGDDAREKWADWLIMSEDRREWLVALSRARAEARWIKWSNDDRRQYSSCLLAPFTVSVELLDKFIKQV